MEHLVNPDLSHREYTLKQYVNMVKKMDAIPDTIMKIGIFGSISQSSIWYDPVKSKTIT